MIKRIKRLLSQRRYNIGFIEGEYSIFQNTYPEIKWMNLNGYRKGWFADPFIFSVNDDYITVLVEEYLYATRLGRLAKITVSRKDYRLLKVDVILDLPTHLSFPIYLEEKGKIYVYPENYQGGSLKIYEYDIVNNKLINPIKIIDEPLLDTQILKSNNHYYAFGVVYRTGTQDDTKILKIYKSDNLFYGWSHIQTIENQRCEERGAGMIYLEEAKLLRPTQDCEGDYGRAVIIKQISNTSNGNFLEKEIKRIQPDNKSQYKFGLHTLHSAMGMTVVDGNGYRHALARLIKKLQRR